MEKINCVFCNIIENKEVYIVAQNDTCIAFLDKNPIANGHILVCPKEHFKLLHEIQDQKIQFDLISLIAEIAKLISKKFSSDYNIHQANGIKAKQSIEHVHFHLIPRFHEDNVNIELPTNKNISISDVFNSIDKEQN